MTDPRWWTRLGREGGRSGGRTGEKGKQELIGKHSCWNKDSNGGEGRREINTQRVKLIRILDPLCLNFESPVRIPSSAVVQRPGTSTQRTSKPIQGIVASSHRKGGVQSVMRHPWLKATPWETLITPRMRQERNGKPSQHGSIGPVSLPPGPWLHPACRGEGSQSQERHLSAFEKGGNPPSQSRQPESGCIENPMF